MTTKDQTDIIAILQQHQDMLGVDKARVKELIESVAAIWPDDPKQTPLNKAIRSVEEVTGVTLAQMQLPDRRLRTKDARHLMAYVLYEIVGLTLHRTGRTINRDHSTVMSSLAVVKGQPSIFNGKLKEVKKRLNMQTV
jgi:chromosomal replication initiation ATPase DnaA